MPAQPQPQPAEPAAFDVVKARLADANVACVLDNDGVCERYAMYQFADTSLLTWSTDSITGAENSITHPASAHGRISGFLAGGDEDDKDEEGDFGTGDFETDVAAFVAWVTGLADQRGRSPQQ
ncbi:hypothetical protein [Streptomyces sp. NBC_00470]|uniref:hypothetical protein n=1 Tax=Streptomyces sp. NBC_00470 TaxID=2975753 RepID=UPI002F90B7E8